MSYIFLHVIQTGTDWTNNTKQQLSDYSMQKTLPVLELVFTYKNNKDDIATS